MKTELALSSAAIEIADGDLGRLVARGPWETHSVAALEAQLDTVMKAVVDGSGPLVVDVADVSNMDVAGAWLVERLRRDGEAAGREVFIEGISAPRQVLLNEVAESARPPAPARPERPYLTGLLSDVGEATIKAGQDLVDLSALFGRTLLTMLRLLFKPTRWRLTAIAHHLEFAGVRAIPIVALISIVIGAIIAQQGAFQLRKFGAETFSVNLVAILLLREVGVLITSIMVAGRSGSAFTAEIGSMKMREEIDAMRVLALDPIEVLVIPRLIGLMIALPVLTLLSDFAGLFGAGLVSWIYIDMPPDAYIAYLRNAVGQNTFWVGLIKAPFMAMVIGLIACREGLNVGGSAESLGRQTTTAVVKAIFVVIVLDGIFAMFFSAIAY